MTSASGQPSLDWHEEDRPRGPERTTDAAKAAEALFRHRFNPSVGDPNAPVTVAIFQDLKCGMCRLWMEETFPGISANEMTAGKLKVTFIEFPLGAASTEVALAEAAKCAAEQDKYLEYITFLYANIRETSADRVIDYAVNVGLDGSLFERCVASRKYRQAVELDIATGNALDVDGTPTFLVMSKKRSVVVLGAQPYESFRRVIEESLRDSAPVGAVGGDSPKPSGGW